MSTDESVTRDLVKVLADGEEGFQTAAMKLVESDKPQWSSTFTTYAQQRASFGAELKGLAATYGDEVSDRGSIAASLHRGWLSVKDAVSGSDPKGVLAAAEQGEEHTVKAYEDALAETGMSPTLRDVVNRQFGEVSAAHNAVREMHRAAAAA